MLFRARVLPVLLLIHAHDSPPFLYFFPKTHQKQTDGSLHIWDLKRRREALSHPQRHPDGVKALDISHDGNTLCSAGADHAVRLLQTGAARDATP